MSEVAKPFLKWVGGKRQLLSELIAHVPPEWAKANVRSYYEPFLGGGALFFALAAGPFCPTVSYLSDSNRRLVRTYQAIKDNVEGVIANLGEYRYDKDFFYEARMRPIDVESDTELAAWFIYMNRAGFNGLYRVNKSGQFNVPFGRYKNPTICDAENLRLCSFALKSAIIFHRPFHTMLSLPNSENFVYCDPPYVPLSATSSFASYTTDGFGDADQALLRDMALELKQRGVHVLLSNSSAPRVRELYKDFTCEEVEARRSVNSKGDRRGALTELLIY